MNVWVRFLLYKLFRDCKITFSFTATHAVSKEVKDEVTTWTLDGQDNVLILLKVKGLEPTELGKETVRSLKQQYGAKSRQSNCKVTLGNETVNGKKVTVEIMGETLTQEVYELKAGSDGYLLIIQDSGATETSETRAAKTLLKQTFKRISSPDSKRTN